MKHLSNFTIQKILEIEETKNDTNGLENFAIDQDTPDLFENNLSEERPELLQNNEDDSHEEDEFEIPAFLRRQKN